MNAAPDDPNLVHQSEPCGRPGLARLTESRNDKASLTESSLCAAAPPGTGRALNERQHAAAWLNLSHELHTPTHAILGQIELLLSGSAGPLSSEMRSSLGDIQRAAIQLSCQIGDVVKCAEALSVPESTQSDQAP